jgi:rifampicin phosphotransferase
VSTAVEMPLIDGAAARALTTEAVGGKVAGLVALDCCGARVPPWWVVPAYAFRAHLERAGIQLDAPPDDEASREAMKVGPLDPALSAALASLPPRRRFAVRSSAVGEDAADRSYAGMFESELGVEHDGLEAALRRCWSSAFTERALAYHRRDRPDRPAPAMAVVIQEMVEGEVSGVLFTQNPASGNSREAMLAATWGLGEGVVSGACDADEYVLSHDGRELSARVAHKPRAIVGARGGGTCTVDVEPHRRDLPCVEPGARVEIVREGMRVAGELGGPRDIEWTMRAGELFLLQARAITTAPTVIWDNSNIQESFSGVTSPLTFSFAVDAYATVYEQTLAALGVSAADLERARPMIQRLIGLVGGRVYYNLAHWYGILRLLPSFGRNKRDMERMMGVTEPVDFVVDEDVGWRQRLRRAPRILRTAVRLRAAFILLPRAVERWLADFDRTLGSVDRSAIAHASYAELIELIEMLRDRVMQRWQTPIVNDIFVMSATGSLRRAIERSAPDRSDAIVARLLAAEHGVESTAPARVLMEIACELRRDPSASELLLDEPKRALRLLADARPDLKRRIDEYIDHYGDRCIGELKLESTSLHQDPSFVVTAIRNYLACKSADHPARHEAELARARQQAQREVERSLGVRGRRRLRRALRRARRGVADRERMRLARTRGFGIHREIYLRLGKLLHELGRLDAPRDVFYLTTAEIADYFNGTAVTVDLAALARLRRDEFDAYERTQPPNRFETRQPPYDQPWPESSTDDGDSVGAILRGLGCSAGSVEAPVRVVEDPHEPDLDVNGRILVAVRTDPGWTPLFPATAGLLIERGSNLSHSAVVARELGIPAVVGVPEVTHIVRDGERVRLDGASGTVVRLER